jgi:hypothetical protein
MRRKKSAWSKLAADAVKLGVTANAVIAFRLAKLALGGPRAKSESKRMLSEKIKAAAAANLSAAHSVLTGQAHLAPGRTVALYQKRVSQNLRRLSKGN